MLIFCHVRVVAGYRLLIIFFDEFFRFQVKSDVAAMFYKSDKDCKKGKFVAIKLMCGRCCRRAIFIRKLSSSPVKSSIWLGLSHDEDVMEDQIYVLPEKSTVKSSIWLGLSHDEDVMEDQIYVLPEKWTEKPIFGIMKWQTRVF